MIRPPCDPASSEPRHGYEAYQEAKKHHHVDDFGPCNNCFPDADTIEEISLDQEDLVVGIGKATYAVHRHERTGDVDWPAQETRESKTLAERVRDGEEIDLLGGDA